MFTRLPNPRPVAAAILARITKPQPVTPRRDPAPNVDATFPTGRYVALLAGIHADYHGRVASVLARTELLHTAGIPVHVLLVDGRDDTDLIVTGWRDQGLIPATVTIEPLARYATHPDTYSPDSTADVTAALDTFVAQDNSLVYLTNEDRSSDRHVLGWVNPLVRRVHVIHTMPALPEPGPAARQVGAGPNDLFRSGQPIVFPAEKHRHAAEVVYGTQPRWKVIGPPAPTRPGVDTDGWLSHTSMVVVAEPGRGSRADQAVAAFVPILSMHRDAVLRVYGAAPVVERRVRAEAERAGVGAALQFHPAVLPGDPRPYMDATVAVIVDDLAGNGTMAAFTVGCPVVAYNDLAGPAGLIRPGRDGMLAANEAELVAAVTAVVTSKGQRARMSRRATRTARRHDKAVIRARWAELFTWATVTGRNE